MNKKMYKNLYICKSLDWIRKTMFVVYLSHNISFNLKDTLDDKQTDMQTDKQALVIEQYRKKVYGQKTLFENYC